MKLPQLSFTTRIANYFLLLALIAVGIVGGVAYFRSKNALQQAAFDRLKVSATLKEAEISRWFEDQQRDFILTTQIPDVQNKLKILLNSADDSAKQEAYLVLDKYLSASSRIKPSLREIFILDRGNRIVLSTDKQREGEYEILANATYVEEVKLGEDFAPIFYVSPITRKPAITLAKPLPNRQGTILVNLDLERIDRIVKEKTGLGTSGETYLVGSLVSKNSFIAGNTDKIEDLIYSLTSPGIDAAMSGMNGFGIYDNYAGDPVLGVYRWLNEQDIALMVEIGRNEAFAPARELASTIVIVGLVSVFGLSLGVTWLARQLSASRKQLEDSSQKLQTIAREAETANRAKSLFLANMSHELRTPLNAILGFSQLMTRDTAVTPEQKESLGIINRSGEHLLNLINDVLEMSKIEAGKTTINPESFDLHELLHVIQEMFKIRAKAQQLWFEFILAPDLPQYIVSDSRKIRQLLINLLSNAVKFTKTGGVTLKAWICTLNIPPTERTARLCFEVSDTGKGIAAEELDRLFDPFVQTASGIESEGGTGLGLAISRQFVELMGGTIGVKSTVGEGSTFNFDIRVSLVELSEIDTLLISRQVKTIAEGQPDYRIAIVDDKETNCQVLERLLNSIGLKTRIASNGKEAIELWQTWQPDLIWMDMRMPVMDGYEATRTIKSQPKANETVIIALTASAFEEQREEIIAAGCDDFVRKPFTEQTIFNKLAQYLGIQYIYESSEDIDGLSPDIAIVQTSPAKQVATLSPTLKIQIHQAAIAVDGEQIQQLLTQIPAEEQNLATEISEMLRNYDFDSIIELTA